MDKTKYILVVDNTKKLSKVIKKIAKKGDNINIAKVQVPLNENEKYNCYRITWEE